MHAPKTYPGGLPRRPRRAPRTATPRKTRCIDIQTHIYIYISLSIYIHIYIYIYIRGRPEGPGAVAEVRRGRRCGRGGRGRGGAAGGPAAVDEPEVESPSRPEAEAAALPTGAVRWRLRCSSLHVDYESPATCSANKRHETQRTT